MEMVMEKISACGPFQNHLLPPQNLTAMCTKPNCVQLCFLSGVRMQQLLAVETRNIPKLLPRTPGALEALGGFQKGFGFFSRVRF